MTAHTSTTLKLPSAAVKDLLRGATETVAVTLTASNSSGTSHSTLTISPLKQPSKTKRTLIPTGARSSPLPWLMSFTRDEILTNVTLFSPFPGDIVRPPRAWLERTANVVRVT